MTKSLEIPEIMANGYSSERTQREVSNEYQQDWVKMISIILLLFCALDESNLSVVLASRVSGCLFGHPN